MYIWLSVILNCIQLMYFQNIVYELKGAAIKPGDDLKVQIKDWEMVGRNR